MTQYEKILEGGPMRLADVLTDVAICLIEGTYNRPGVPYVSVPRETIDKLRQSFYNDLMKEYVQKE